MHPEQKRIYQSMTPAKKLKTALKLYHSAKKLKAASLKALHPDWGEEKIGQVLRDFTIYGRT